MNVYVSGGSSEIGQVERLMQQVRGMGHTITHDWTRAVRIQGESNPRNAQHVDRLAWSGEDLAGIDCADVVWVILPVKPSFGCAFEAGYALGVGRVVVMSGDWRATIFSSQAMARCDSHDGALEWLRTRVRK
jgi:hypothetical protein